MIIGERPGAQEARERAPFVGASGNDLARYLRRARVDITKCYRTNVCQDYAPDNPDPSPADMQRWRDTLEEEITGCDPTFIIAVGRLSARALVHADLDLSVAHGTPQDLDRNRWPLASRDSKDVCVIPCYHPAAALHQPRFQALVLADYLAAGAIINGVRDHAPARDTRRSTCYRLLNSRDPADIVFLDHVLARSRVFACDTEGTRKDPIYIQISDREGYGYCVDAQDRALISRIDERFQSADVRVIFHSALHDLGVMRAMDMRVPAHFDDTMTRAYVLQSEPLSLKALARRHAGMRMQSYTEVIAPAQHWRALAYLQEALANAPESWTLARERVEIVEGVAKIRKPWTLVRRIKRILDDCRKVRATRTSKRADADVRAKHERIDLVARWRNLPIESRQEIERERGPFPIATLRDVARTRAIQYAGRDPDATLRVLAPLQAQSHALELDDVCALDCAVMPMFERMQANGLALDLDRVRVLSREMAREMKRSASALARACGIPGINPNSTPQLLRAITRLRLPKPTKTTDSGAPKVDDSYLEGQRTRLGSGAQYDALTNVVHYRECLKIKSTYTDPFLILCDPDGRLRGHWRLTQVVTGRPSMSEPNLLNIPIRTELGRRVRACFIAPEGTRLCTADYSGIEMRLLAHVAQDERMIGVFRRGEDIHDFTASRIFDLPIARLNKIEHRIPAKMVGFRTMYGGGAKGLREGLAKEGVQWSLDKCQEFIDDYTRKLYPGIGRYMRRTIRQARVHGYVREPLAGRIRYLPHAASEDDRLRASAEREAINFPIQGAAASLMKRGMVALWRGLQAFWRTHPQVRAEPLLQQYDELTFEADEDCVDTLERIVLDSMSNAAELRVPIKVSWSTARDWASLEK